MADGVVGEPPAFASCARSAGGAVGGGCEDGGPGEDGATRGVVGVAGGFAGAAGAAFAGVAGVAIGPIFLAYSTPCIAD